MVKPELHVLPVTGTFNRTRLSALCCIAPPLHYIGGDLDL